jgi:NTE family protein
MTDKKTPKGPRIFQDAAQKPRGLAMALGGGMARGFAHIGVLKVLERHGIKPDIVAGTSIGAVVGAAYLAGKLDELEQWALSLNRMKVLSYLDVRVRSAGIMGGKRLEKLLKANFSDLVIEDLPHPFAAVSTDLITGHEVWIRKGSVIEAVRASFALPGVFPPVERQGRFLIDGALVNPVPVSPCLAMRSRMTIAVDLHADVVGKAAKPGSTYQTVTGFDLFNDRDVPPEEQKKHKTPLTERLFKREQDTPSLFGVMISSLGIMMDRMTRSRLSGDPPDVHIKPQIGHIGLLEFEKAPELIEQGEIAAMRALPDIQAAIDVFLAHQYEE